MVLKKNVTKRGLRGSPDKDGERVMVAPLEVKDIDPACFARALERGDLVDPPPEVTEPMPPAPPEEPPPAPKKKKGLFTKKESDGE